MERLSRRMLQVRSFECCVQHLYLLQVQSVKHDPVTAAKGIVARQLGSGNVEKFTFVAIEADLATGHDVFELASNANGTITVRGNTGVLIASGVYWYLRYHCNSSLTWGVNGTGDNIQLPSPLPSCPIRSKPSAAWWCVHTKNTINYQIYLYSSLHACMPMQLHL
eukprot:TRINITY_DN12325_c0_g1_i21.p4 TRINITY_DN12325_c0_g1~~TRINITY_DN12325_c0_g1_i21.p4  ORF type:complete len:165 (+),score=8.09 TRINITY_DN12325_c0_g1_i21:55-549(+)